MSSARFKAVIFDMDGTITLPFLDFKKIREEINIPSGDIIAEIEKMGEAERRAAWDIIERHEESATRNTRLQPHARETLHMLRQARVKIGLVTRNTQKSVAALTSLLGLEFEAALTREHPHVKPSPEPILRILGQWGVPPGEALMVGDHLHDMESGRSAGAVTCFFHNKDAADFAAFADHTVTSFKELEKLIFP